ncbi:UNVERIFIED_CONTAM: hypothetical protein Sangu_2959500 [Sesamum angustifolium]|uniref:Reverse transcriptase zinc-binding domain-containing protein n=1 Tax=Sesamum angustifolium TaxID=2727405 RepID=A0AAW2IK82_9LAMI
MSKFVSRLLNADCSWNLDLVRNEFGSLNTECILQVSTRSAPILDRVIWHFGEKGTFSISSAYKLVAERAEEASSSSIETCSGTAGNWFFISKAKVPPKVLMFAWRCYKNALSSYSKLLSRGIRLDGNCLCCDLMEDGLNHVLRRCSFARLVWALSNLPWYVLSRDDLSTEDWMRYIHSSLGLGGFESFFIIAWHLWVDA